MIPKECKRLIEVDFPIAEVSRSSLAEKKIFKYHPQGLHQWWARRPLAACRAVLMGLLLPDLCDEHCPEDFKTQARQLLPKLVGNVGKSNEDLRAKLLKFIADFSNWDHSAHPTYLEVARALVKAAYGEEPPLVVDPFAGGGSIPLEALRVGCDTFASDLNPVACLILKVMLEDIPRHGKKLADELRRVGAETKAEAEKELADFYPPDPDGSKPIAYLWARTVTCESPNCGAEIPLVRSFWLCNNTSRQRALRYKVIKPSSRMPDPVTGFQPVNPWKHPELGIRSRHLPHLQTPDATYFVTFHCTNGIELPEQARDVVLAAVIHWHGKKIDLDAAVVMPDHVHMIFRLVGQASSLSHKQSDRPQATSTLSSILHSIKSYSANEVNKLLKRKGALWQDESFDHIIRHGEEWEEKVEYIRHNPVKKGLVGKVEDYKWIWLKYDRQDACPTIEFEIFEPKKDSDVPAGTVHRGNAKCLCCGTVLPVERVRAQLVPRRGGADDARLLAVVTLKPGEQGRHYRLPTERDYNAVRRAQERLKAILDEWKVAQASSLSPDMTGKMPVPQKMLCPVPDEPLPPQGTLGFRVQRYGMTTWGDLFTARQKVAICTIESLIRKFRNSEDPVRMLLAFAASRLPDRHASLVQWFPKGEISVNVFMRQALPMIWSFAEANPISDASGSLSNSVEQIAGVVERVSVPFTTTGQVAISDARSIPLPDESANLLFTDPPYYDAIPYADLSDFFFVWLKRFVPKHRLLGDPFDPSNHLTPKYQEIIQDETKTYNNRPKDKSFFEKSIACSFAEGRRILKADGIASVVFAHKTTEGWEALLGGMLSSGWTIVASWPISTERAGRMRAQKSAALAASVHLICRPRPLNAGIGDWTNVYNEMKGKVANWMERLAQQGVRGADLVFACIGPALEVYSRYEKVVDANDNNIPLGGDPLAAEPHQRGYLSYIWEVVGRTALEQVLGTAEARARNGAAGVLEEDARLTALFLWTLMSSSAQNGNGAKVEDDEDEEEAKEEKGGKKKAGYSLVYDVARRFAQPLGIDLDKWKGRIIEIEKGVVRLIPIKERAKQLFGEESLSKIAAKLEKGKADIGQLILFADLPDGQAGEDAPIAPSVKSTKVNRGRKTVVAIDDRPREATTLDRVHAAMLLQASGQSAALKALIEAEQKRGTDFVRLANALSALYPKSSEEKRLLDAMLLAVPRR